MAVARSENEGKPLRCYSDNCCPLSRSHPQRAACEMFTNLISMPFIVVFVAFVREQKSVSRSGKGSDACPRLLQSTHTHTHTNTQREREREREGERA
eukprot:764116-Hanusia_phi.AAC.4